MKLFIECSHECGQCTHHINSSTAPELQYEVHSFFLKNPQKLLAAGLIAAIKQMHRKFFRAGGMASDIKIIIRAQMYRKITFSNQARAGLWPARAWFLEITLMRTSVFVCVSVCPPPRLLETSGVICGVM